MPFDQITDSNHDGLVPQGVIADSGVAFTPSQAARLHVATYLDAWVRGLSRSKYNHPPTALVQVQEELFWCLLCI